ncbi:PREDICTED: uncharacterized protein LOC107186837 [Dufourea novaeangliae]|uniref:Uncharacterized protein n=1 Tax=Dufourea novaeangliae TaxID=178035 RepID=A0A154PBJ6_DUFNO|nr:PREDICTED: uncharacterized protein LOC107186837 [Dufourea novaeangliae]KZC08774.1 hypothetical protein WN55_10797 [Dufourea novaeangliae]
MSCIRYQSTNPSRERCYYDGQYNHYTPPSYSSRIRPQDPYQNDYYTGWRPVEFQGHNSETSTAARGDLPFPDPRMQTGRMAVCKQEKQLDTLVFEKMQTRLKFLEDSNTVIQTRNQNLVAENKALLSQLEEERNEAKRLEDRLASQREELDLEKLKLLETRETAEQSLKTPNVEANGTSTTNIISKLDRGVQIWAVCMGCQRKLESCEKLPPTVTITKSELEVLEKDMQTLRDTIIAREEAWDKAMEREQNYRQQLTRLITETITARHLSETRHEELQAVTKTLSEKESELKSLQKDNLYLNKLIVLLYNCQQSRKGKDECQRGSLTVDINEKDQRSIEEIVRRMSSGKNKLKLKPKSACSEKSPNYGIHQASPRDRNAKTMKDQAGSLKEPKR